MRSGNNNDRQELVPVTLELPRDIVDWIDGLKLELGFRSRGVIVAQLLRELATPSEADLDEPSSGCG
jgi:hypothetical protein